MKSFKIATCGAFVVASVACGGEESGGSTYGENVEALGEQGCATYGGHPYGSSASGRGGAGGSGARGSAAGSSGPGGGAGSSFANNGTTQIAVPPPCGGWNANFDFSPNASYGTSLQCPGQWIFEVQQTLERVVYIVPVWAAALPNAAECQHARMEVGSYVRDAAAAWHDSLITKYHGVWDGSQCVFELDPGYSTIAFYTGSDFNAVRAAGRAVLGSVQKEIALVVFGVPLC